MDFKSQLVITGLLVAAFMWGFAKLAKNSPKSWGGKGADELLQENKSILFASNVLFYVAAAGGVALYYFGYFHRNDWRGLVLTFGLATVSPVLFLLLASIGKGSQRFKELLVASASVQRVPLGVLYGGFALGAICLFVALGSMI